MIAGSEMPDCTCYRLRQAARLLSRNYDAFLVSCGLNIGQFGVLATVAEMEGSSISRLAEALRMDRTTLTRNLNPLRKLGLVAVSTGTDVRSRAIALSPAGRRLLEDARPRWKAAQLHFAKEIGKHKVLLLHSQLDDLLQRVLD